MNRKRLVRTVAAAAVGLLVAGTVAYAAWTVNGGGTGTASATSAVPLTLSGGTPSGALYPGATADVDTSASNTNPFPVHIASVAIDTSQGSNGFGVDCRPSRLQPGLPVVHDRHERRVGLGCRRQLVDRPRRGELHHDGRGCQ